MEKGDTEIIDNYALLCGNGYESSELGTWFFIHKQFMKQNLVMMGWNI
jgi:hypothetical protein